MAQKPAHDSAHRLDVSLNASQDSVQSAALLGFLDAVSAEAGVAFDRSAARRRVGGIGPIEPSRPESLESGLLEFCSSGPAGGLRMDRLLLTCEEAARVLRPQAPLGKLLIDARGALSWLLLIDHDGTRVRVRDGSAASADAEARWMSVAELEALVTLGSASRVSWIAVQSMHPYGDHSDESGGHAAKDESPFAAYLRLLRPESSDAWVLVVFSLFVGLLALAAPIAVETLVNTLAFGQLVQPVVVLALILTIVMTFGAAMRAVQTYVAEIIQRRIYVRVTAEVAHRLPRAPLEYWRHHYGPELVNRFFDVLTIQKASTQLLLEGVALIVQTLVGMAVIAFYHPILLGFDAFLIGNVTVIVFLLGKGAVRTSISESVRKYETAAWLEELARHPLAFRSRNGMNFAIDRIDRHLADYVAARTAHFRILFRQIVAALGLEVVASTVLLAVGGWLVVRDELTLGQLVAAELIVSLIVGAFAKIGKHLEAFYDALAASDKLAHLFHIPVDSLEGVDMKASDAPLAVAIHGLRTSPSLNKAAIVSAEFEIKPGEMLAVTGSSAAMRSALLWAIAGLQRPQAGYILVDGVDVRRLRGESLRDQIAVVGEAEIFHGTIATNIHVGRPDVGEDQLSSALRDVGMLEEISAMPAGLATILETEGQPLTRDQAVRLSLARAIAGRPRLLLVDTALDSLPDDQLAAILPSLKAHCDDWTLVVSTGRMDVAEALDRTVHISDSGAVSKGPLKAAAAAARSGNSP